MGLLDRARVPSPARLGRRVLPEEIEPLDLVFPGAAYSRNPKAKALADPLKQQVKDRGLWALFLDRELGGPGSASSSSPC